MNHFSKKFIIAMMAILFAISPFAVFAQTNNACSSKGYTIATINGVFTDEAGAILNKKALEYFLFGTYHGEPLIIDYLLNPSHLGGVGDILKSIQQGLFDSEIVKDYDLVEILQDASERVATQKLLLVAHSQGNFYANSFYDTVADKTGGVPAESFGVYSVATPSSRVAGGGKWLTSNTDKVIAGIVGHIPFRKIMEPNAHIKLQSGDDFWGHSFSDIYLKYQSDKIISDIKSSLDQLKTNNIQDVQKPCFAPPELSVAHQRQGEVFSFVDPIANVVLKLPIVIVQTAVSIAKAGVEKVVEVAQAIGETFSNVFKKDQFQLAQVIDLSQETQLDQSGQTSQSSNSKQCSFDTQKSVSYSKVIINEVSWMGGISSANDEWIELKNISGGSLDISGYQLLDQAEQIKIIFPKDTKIPAGGFLLLERNSDEAVPSVKADLIYSGALSNTDEGLRLFDANCNLIDEVLANPKWPAGDNTAKKTMERNSSNLNWHASNIVSGTPKKENSQPVVVKKQEPLIDISEETKEDEEITPQQEEVEQQEQVQQVESFKQCSFNTSQSAQRQGVIINEVAWMGTANSANDEWIELKNISGVAVNIFEWQLLDKDEQIKIKFDSGSQIPAGGFYLLERTDDDTVPDVKADKIYTGGLSNSNEGLRLFDSQCNLIDEVLANPDWTAGDNIGKNTMERKSDFSWQTSANVGGTPKKENSSGYVIYGGGGSGGGGTPVNNQQQTTNNPSSAPAKILITEIQISPTGNRFIELYNLNNFSVDLTNWYLQRKTQTGASFGSLVSKTYFEGKVIGANGYFLISRSALDGVDIVLGDLTLTESNAIQLKNSSGDVVDKVGWGQASDCENNCASEILVNQSIQRKFQNDTFVDTDNNAQDFEVQTCPSPKNQLGNCAVANQSPSAFFVYAPENPNVGDLVSFDAASSTDSDGIISLFQWDFGDNTTSSLTTATTTYSYSQAGDYLVKLTVFDNQSASSTKISTIHVEQSGINHIVVSEIMAGAGIGRSDEEFVEFYNPTNEAVNLSSWSLKRKTSQNSTSTLNLVLKFSATSTIPAKGFFLVAHQSYPNYSSSTTADFFYTNNSNPLAYEDDVVILYNSTGEIVDEVAYQNIEAGKSLERKAFSNGICISAQGDGEFLGNGCDTDSSDNFEIRQIPKPQNYLSSPEPRSTPTVPTDFVVQYSSSTMKLSLNWQSSQDYSGANSAITYKITNINDVSLALATINTTSTTAEISISEIGRDYKFSIQAFDKENFGSATSTSSISVPSFLSGLYLYQDPRDNSKNLIEAYYEQYPFIPDLFNQNKWQVVAFYLNDNLSGQLNELTNALTIKYKQCVGGTAQVGSLIIPASSYYCGNSGGAFSQALDFSELEDNHFIIQTAGSNQELNLTNQNYLTVAFYTTYNTETYDGRSPSFQLVAIDKTKYYFKDNLPTHYAPDFTGEIALNFDQQNSRLNLSWTKASDRDTLDSLLTYEIKYNESDNWQPLIGNATGTSRAVAPDDNFSISVRAKDDFDNYSASTLAAIWSYPETTFFITQDIASSWSDGFGQMDWNGNYGVSLQSITSENDFQFNTIVLKVKHAGGNDYGTTLKLSVFSNNATNNQPDFNNLIASASLVGFLNNSEDQDLAFYFANPVSVNAGIKYWLALEVESYSYGGYYVLIGNSWVNAIAENNPYNLGEAGRTTIRNSSYNDNVSINPDADWYMKIGMTKDE